MSKLGCICGNTIVDQTDNIRYKAYFIRDQDLDAMDDQTADISDFIEALKKGERDKWLNQYFGSDTYKNLPDSAVIGDITIKYKLKYESDMFLCENCGRVKIEKGIENKFISFSPDDNQWVDIFKGLSKP